MKNLKKMDEKFEPKILKKNFLTQNNRSLAKFIF